MGGCCRRPSGEPVPSCGKETPVKLYENDEQCWASLLWLAEVSMCSACEAEFSKARDECPETVILENGVSGCQLGWKHAGRCEPYEFDLRVLRPTPGEDAAT